MHKTLKTSRLLSSEDYWAIWLGGFFMIIGMIIFLLLGPQEFAPKIRADFKIIEAYPIKSISWHKGRQQLEQLKGKDTPLGKKVGALLAKPKKWQENPLKGFYAQPMDEIPQMAEKTTLLEEDVARYEKEAIYDENQAQQSLFQNEVLNKRAEASAKTWLEQQRKLDAERSKARNPAYNMVPTLAVLGIALGLVFATGATFMGQAFFAFLRSFIAVFGLAVIAYFLAAQADMKDLGISYAVWAIVIGLIISNSLGTAKWLKPAIQTEYYIKTGLVLLGAEILLGKIAAIGLPGIFVAWVVTPIVLVSTYWFGQKVLKIGSKTLNITISADMSVCGVSAAIATAAACKAKKEELTLAVGLSMVFTSVMMIAMPAFINAVGMPEVLGGAWIGGTIDATGAVVAAGAFLGDKALNVAATIKMIQNVLIGLIAFGVAVYWAGKVEKNEKSTVGVAEIWNRFPKFILGFLGASIIFSVIYTASRQWFSEAFIDHGLIAGYSKNLRGWLFCLAFVSIGLSVNFKELMQHFSGGRPLLLYVCGQALNLALTLLMAYIMFYLVFLEITEQI
jgi:uncharacterized membrane protein YadS